MLLLVYLLPLAFILIYSHESRNKAVRRSVLFGYNYLFSFGICLWLEFQKSYPTNMTDALLSILETLYPAAKCITFDTYFNTYTSVYQDLPNGNFLRLQIWLIMIIASLCTASVLLSFFRAAHRLGVDFCSNFRSEIIIAGYNVNGVALAKDVLKNTKNQTVTVLRENAGQDLINESDFNRLRVKNVSSIEEYLTHRFGKKKERFGSSRSFRIAIITEDKNMNLHILGQLEKNCGNYKNLKVSVLCDNDFLRFHTVHKFNLDVYFFSAEKLIVENLMRDVSPVKIMAEKNKITFPEDGIGRVTEPFSLAVIGFGKTGREFLLSAYERSRFLTEDGLEAPFKALVIDAELENLRKDFLLDVPHFAESDEITFISAPIGSTGYYDAIHSRLPHIHQFVISTNDNSLNIAAANHLAEFLRIYAPNDCTPKILVRIKENTYDKEYVFDYKESGIFNTTRDVFTFEQIVNRSIDEAARSFHETYFKGNGKTKPWEGLSFFEKESNRSAAADINTKLRLCNINSADGSGRKKLEKLLSQEKSVEILAQYEHNRWNAFHYARGWMPMQMSADGKTKNLERRQHMCLTSWDGLEELSKLQDQPYKEYDRENVRLLSSVDLQSQFNR